MVELKSLLHRCINLKNSIEEKLEQQVNKTTKTNKTNEFRQYDVISTYSNIIKYRKITFIIKMEQYTKQKCLR